MFKALFRFLNRDVTGRTSATKASHPYFGDMVLFAVKDSDKSYWEAGADFEGYRIDVAIAAPDCDAPSEQQTEFARRIISDPDAAFARAAPMLAHRFERWHRKPLPEDWRAALKLVGLSVPADGNEQNKWDLSYESLWDPSGHLFTCYFEHGKPVSVSVDG